MNWSDRATPWIERAKEIGEKNRLILEIIKLSNELNVKLWWKEPIFTADSLLDIIKKSFPLENITKLEQVEVDYFKSFLETIKSELEKLNNISAWNAIHSILQ